jgi:hypothetical protein
MTTLRDECIADMAREIDPFAFEAEIDPEIQERIYVARGKAVCAFDAMIERLKSPSLSMIRAALVDTDLTAEHLDFGAEVMEGMPPARPDLQRKGIEAAADLYRDWQAMLSAVGEG